MWWRFQSSFVRWLYIKSKWHVAWLIVDQICYCLLTSRQSLQGCFMFFVTSTMSGASDNTAPSAQSTDHGRGGPWLDILLVWACGGFHWSFSFFKADSSHFTAIFLVYPTSPTVFFLMVLLPWSLGSSLRFFVPFFGLGLQGFQTRKHRLAVWLFNGSIVHNFADSKLKAPMPLRRHAPWSYQGILQRCLRVFLNQWRKVHMRKLGFKPRSSGILVGH